MRVISGKLKGRIINGFDIPGTRPTMSRVKESIFSMIQNYLDQAVVLDLFSGSGNYGIESISNGCLIAYFNDYNKKCIKVIRDNLDKMNVLDQSVITNMDYLSALKYYRDNNIKFDIVFLDPPYKMQVIDEILDYIFENDLLNKNGLVICEVLKKESINRKYTLFKEKKYGEKDVLIYKNDN